MSNSSSSSSSRCTTSQSSLPDLESLFSSLGLDDFIQRNVSVNKDVNLQQTALQIWPTSSKTQETDPQEVVDKCVDVVEPSESTSDLEVDEESSGRTSGGYKSGSENQSLPPDTSVWSLQGHYQKHFVGARRRSTVGKVKKLERERTGGRAGKCMGTGLSLGGVEERFLMVKSEAEMEDQGERERPSLTKVLTGSKDGFLVSVGTEQVEMEVRLQQQLLDVGEAIQGSLKLELEEIEKKNYDASYTLSGDASNLCIKTVTRASLKSSKLVVKKSQRCCNYC